MSGQVDRRGEVVRVLRAARDTLAVPERWTKKESARNVAGRPVLPTEPDAVCWCMAGAVKRAAATDGIFFEAITNIEQAMWCDFNRRHYSDIAAFNDAIGTTHADVLRLFDASIQRAESEGDA